MDGVVLYGATWNPNSINQKSEISEKEVRQAVARALHELRKRRGMSQDDMGYETGVGRRHAFRLEKEEPNPTTLTLVRYCDVLGISMKQWGAEFDKQRKKRSL